MTPRRMFWAVLARLAEVAAIFVMYAIHPWPVWVTVLFGVGLGADFYAWISWGAAPPPDLEQEAEQATR